MIRRSPTSESQAIRAYEVVKTEILSCTIRPGDILVQRELAERYNLGLTPIREALQRLAQDGYLTPVPRMGYTVNAITVRDLREQYELREILEGAAARLAATRATPAQLQQIQQLAQRTYVFGDRSSYADFLEDNSEFHRSVAAASGNGKLADAVSKALDEQFRVFHLGLDLRDSAAEMREEHTALALAIFDHDPDRAERIVRAQIQSSRQRVEEALILGTGRPFLPEQSE